MDVVLLALTTLSLAAAAGFGFVSWRVGREQRQREQARVAALTTAMAGPTAVRGRSDTESASSLRSLADGRSGLGDAFPSEADPRDTEVAVGSLFDRATDGVRGRPGLKAAVV